MKNSSKFKTRCTTLACFCFLFSVLFWFKAGVDFWIMENSIWEVSSRNEVLSEKELDMAKKLMEKWFKIKIHDENYDEDIVKDYENRAKSLSDFSQEFSTIKTVVFFFFCIVLFRRLRVNKKTEETEEKLALLQKQTEEKKKMTIIAIKKKRENRLLTVLHKKSTRKLTTKRKT